MAQTIHYLNLIRIYSIFSFRIFFQIKVNSNSLEKISNSLVFNFFVFSYLLFQRFSNQMAKIFNFYYQYQMKAIVFALLVAVAISGLSNIAVSPIQSVIVGSPSSFYLDSSRPDSVFFKAVTVPDFVKIGTDGLFSCTAPKVGAWPIQVRVYDKNSGDYQSRQYNLRALDRSSRVYTTDGYYQRDTSSSVRVVLDNTATLKVNAGDNFNYQFNTVQANGTRVYAYFGLPEGLSGDRSTGRISGRIASSGAYTFGCEVADQSGNSHEGFVTLTVVAQSSSLNTVTIPTKVSYQFDLNQVRQNQVAADRKLFDALAVVNAAKAKLAAKKAVLDDLTVKLAVAESNADTLAATTAKFSAERQRASERLRLTNKALGDAQDQLNLALLDQAGAIEAVKTATKVADAAQARFNAADANLKAAQINLQNAVAALKAAQQALIKADNNLKNAQRDFQRASQDLNEAKDALQRALSRQTLANADVVRAQDALQLAQKAYADAKNQLQLAALKLSQADHVRQQALKTLQDANFALQQANSDLGAAQWQLELASQALITAQARKQAADRSSALAIVQSSTSISGATTTYNSLGGWSTSSSSTADYIVRTDKNFGTCSNTIHPRFAGSARITEVDVGTLTLSTGHQVVFGDCTQGLKNIRPGRQIIIDGAVNVQRKTIQAFNIKNATL